MSQHPISNTNIIVYKGRGRHSTTINVLTLNFQLSIVSYTCILSPEKVGKGTGCNQGHPEFTYWDFFLG